MRSAFDPLRILPRISDMWRMVTVIKRLALSLLAGGIALVAAYRISFRVLWFEVAKCSFW